jgi:NAD(P)-dependent dehydrogenase (short-subunit alcohol dehydrogenase family)
MSTSFDFTGRTVIVTGAAHGIGLGIARLFVAAAAKVAPFDLDPRALCSVWGEQATPSGLR